MIGKIRVKGATQNRLAKKNAAVGRGPKQRPLFFPSIDRGNPAHSSSRSALLRTSSRSGQNFRPDPSPAKPLSEDEDLGEGGTGLAIGLNGDLQDINTVGQSHPFQIALIPVNLMIPRRSLGAAGQRLRPDEPQAEGVDAQCDLGVRVLRQAAAVVQGRMTSCGTTVQRKGYRRSAAR